MTKAGNLRHTGLGFRAHSGWAAAVAVAGPMAAPVVVDRRRIELVDRAAGELTQPYHAAAKFDLKQAEQLVGRSALSARGLARRAIETIRDDLKQAGHEVIACGILMGSGRAAKSLAATLASHPMIHTAEGNLFRNALIEASEECGLRILQVTEREVYARGEARLGVASGELKRVLLELGRPVGSPWRQDEKLAALAGWLGLLEPAQR